jgi:SAM-dependent methyltransferase
MRLVILARPDAGLGGLERFVHHNLEHADAILFVHRSTRHAERSRLVDFQRKGLPVIVLDVPRWPLIEGELLDQCRNAWRHLRPEVVLVLDTNERAVCASTDQLEREIRALPPGPLAVWLRDQDERGAPGRGRRQVRATRLYPAAFLEGGGGVSPSSGRSPKSRHVVQSLHVLRSGPSEARWRVAVTGLRAMVEGQLARLKRAPSRSGRAVGPVAPSRSPIMPRESGVLPAEYHAESLYLDIPPFRFVWEKYRPASVLDVGCGLGGYVKLFADWGAHEVVGVDGFEPTPAYLAGESYIQHDLRTPLDLGRRFDLVVCAEVIEHLDARHEDQLIESLRRHAGALIVFSAARVDQPGRGHVNTRPIEYWMAKWRRVGWRPVPFDTLAMRLLANYFWFRRNLLVLSSLDDPDRPSGKFTDADLASYEWQRVGWVDQPARICEYPLALGLGRADP